MRIVPVHVLKQNLAEIVHAVESGERVTLTRRNRVVAELVPPGMGDVRLGKPGGGSHLRRLSSASEWHGILATLLDDRAEDR